jgi:hypothetical protein
MNLPKNVHDGQINTSFLNQRSVNNSKNFYPKVHANFSELFNLIDENSVQSSLRQLSFNNFRFYWKKNYWKS